MQGLNNPSFSGPCTGILKIPEYFISESYLIQNLYSTIL